MTTIETAPAPRTAGRSALPAEQPAIITDLYDALTTRGMSLVDVAWEQQRLHESRRWSVMEMLAAGDADRLTDPDQMLVLNASRAKLPTKPSAGRLERRRDDAYARER